jgi:hypothetical protein
MVRMLKGIWISCPSAWRVEVLLQAALGSPNYGPVPLELGLSYMRGGAQARNIGFRASEKAATWLEPTMVSRGATIVIRFACLLSFPTLARGDME